MSMIQALQSNLINNQYIVKKKISQGSFGTVFQGQDNILNITVAIKVEKTHEGESSSLKREVMQKKKKKIQQFLQSYMLSLLNGVPQVPRLYWFGAGEYNGSDVMVIQFLGRDLTYYLKKLRRFSLKCVINIALQSLEILENIHQRSIIHRDIKPENILIGRDKKSNQIYIVDFGVSKVFRNKNGQHVPMIEGKPFIGTTRYASIAAHKNIELGRKDDLESLGYVLIFLLKGSLPWQNLKVLNEELKIQKVGQMKMKIKSDEICSGLPIEFVRYFDYVKKLAFSAQPDYRYLKSLFEKIWEQQQFQNNGQVFDWDLKISNNQGSQGNLVNLISNQQSCNRIPFRKYSDEQNNGINSVLHIKRQEFSRVTGGSSINQQDDISSLKNKYSLPSLCINQIQDINVYQGKQIIDSSNNESYSSNDNVGSVMLRFQGSKFTIKSSNFHRYRNNVVGSSFNNDPCIDQDILNKGSDLLEIPLSKFSQFNQKDSPLNTILQSSQQNYFNFNTKQEFISVSHKIIKDEFSESNLNAIEDGNLSDKYLQLKKLFVNPQLKRRIYNSEERIKK